MSDYDVCVVLNQGPDFDVEFTYVDERPTDVIFVSRDGLRRLTADEGERSERELQLVHWLGSGRTAIDTSGDIEALRQAAASRRLSSVDRHEIFFAWVATNFNLAVNRRYFEHGDTSYLRALDLRLLAAIAALPREYLLLRGLPWLGEKDALRWLEANDPRFLAVLERCVNAASRAERMQSYETAVERACEPVGGTWPRGETAGGWTARYADGAASKSLWEQLING